MEKFDIIHSPQGNNENKRGMCMQRIKLEDRVLPTYTRGEDIFNMVSHILGAVMGIAATALCSVFAALHHNVYGVISGAIFGATLILLYTMSSIYHGLKPHRKAKKVFQIIDHCSIFLLIAGSYTPFCLCTIREYNTALGWTFFGIIWGLAILGIILNSIDLHRYKIFSMICYLAMGWLIIFKIDLIFNTLPRLGFYLLLGGGISYTLGAIAYGLGRNKKWFHSIFHIACIIGSLLHFLCILFFVI